MLSTVRAVVSVGYCALAYTVLLLAACYGAMVPWLACALPARSALAVRTYQCYACEPSKRTDRPTASTTQCLWVCVCLWCAQGAYVAMLDLFMCVCVCVCKRFAFVSVCYAVCRVLAVCIRWVWPQWPLACYRTRRCLEYYIHLYSVRCDGPAMARARFLEAVSRPNSPRSTNVINETPDGN